jgi:REP element-mobilizing transposase RayT
MTINHPKYHRRSIRLKGYDYTQTGAYFVTIVTKDRQYLFGEIVDGKMRSNDAGRIVEQCWLEIPTHFPHVALDAYIIMPNHIHGILWIVETMPVEPVGAKNFSPPLTPSTISPQPPSDTEPQPASNPPPHGTSKTIGSVVRGFKIGVTKWFRQNTKIYTVWQRNYYEHIIRNAESLQRIRAYIATNPLRLAMDYENHALFLMNDVDP